MRYPSESGAVPALVFFPRLGRLLHGPLHQIASLLPETATDSAKVDQSDENCAHGEEETEGPINQERNPIEVRFQNSLPPNQHAGGDREAEHPQPAAKCIGGICHEPKL